MEVAAKQHCPSGNGISDRSDALQSRKKLWRPSKRSCSICRKRRRMFPAMTLPQQNSGWQPCAVKRRRRKRRFSWNNSSNSSAARRQRQCGKRNSTLQKRLRTVSDDGTAGQNGWGGQQGKREKISFERYVQAYYFSRVLQNANLKLYQLPAADTSSGGGRRKQTAESHLV